MASRNGVSILLRNKGKELWEQGLNDREMAEAIGCSRTSANSWRKAENLESNKTGIVEDQLDDYGRRLHNEGFSDQAIADKLGCALGTVFRWRKRRGLEPNCCAGSEDWYACLGCIEKNSQLMKLHELGLTDREGAIAMNVTYAAYRIRRLKLGLRANPRRKR